MCLYLITSSIVLSHSVFLKTEYFGNIIKNPISFPYISLNHFWIPYFCHEEAKNKFSRSRILHFNQQVHFSIEIQQQNNFPNIAVPEIMSSIGCYADVELTLHFPPRDGDWYTIRKGFLPSPRSWKSPHTNLLCCSECLLTPWNNIFPLWSQEWCFSSLQGPYKVFGGPRNHLPGASGRKALYGSFQLMPLKEPGTGSPLNGTWRFFSFEWRKISWSTSLFLNSQDQIVSKPWFLGKLA